MILLRLLYRLYVFGAALGLWTPPPDASWGGGGGVPFGAAQRWHPIAPGARCCGAALVQGRRFSQEDRAVVAEWALPRLQDRRSAGGGSGSSGSGGGGCSGGGRRRGCSSDAGLLFAGVYDGHEGSTVSDYLARSLHTQLLPIAAAHLHTTSSSTADVSCSRGLNATSLRAALSRACLAANRRLSARLAAAKDEAGSTAVFAIAAGRQLLIGNVGNSRAILCRRAHRPPPAVTAALANDTAAADSPVTEDASSEGEEAEAADGAVTRPIGPLPPPQPPLVPLPLSSDHVPSRADEASRIASAGGTVARATRGGRPRLDGDLEVSRAFGDVSFQRRGLTADPEFEFHEFDPQSDALLVLASDGVFEGLTAEDVCAHAWAEWSGDDTGAPRAPPPAPAIALGPAGGDTGASGSSSSSSGSNAGGDRASPQRQQQKKEQRQQKKQPEEKQVGLAGSCGEFGTGEAAAAAAEAAARGVPRRPPACRPPGVPAPYTLAQAVAARIVEEAYNRGSNDNLAVVCLDVGASAMAAAQAAAEQAAAAVAGFGETEAMVVADTAPEGSLALPFGPWKRDSAGGGSDRGACTAEGECGAGEDSRSRVTGDSSSSSGDIMLEDMPGLWEALAAAYAASEGDFPAAGASGTAANVVVPPSLPGSCVLLGARQLPGPLLQHEASAAATGDSDSTSGGGGSGGEASGSATAMRLISGTSLVCRSSSGSPDDDNPPDHVISDHQGRTYDLLAHLADAPLQPPHVHVWPSAQLLLAGDAFGGEWLEQDEFSSDPGAPFALAPLPPVPPAAPGTAQVCEDPLPAAVSASDALPHEASDSNDGSSSSGGGGGGGSTSGDVSVGGTELASLTEARGACRFSGGVQGEHGGGIAAWARQLATLPLHLGGSSRDEAGDGAAAGSTAADAAPMHGSTAPMHGADEQAGGLAGEVAQQRLPPPPPPPAAPTWGQEERGGPSLIEPFDLDAPAAGPPPTAAAAPPAGPTAAAVTASALAAAGWAGSLAAWQQAWWQARGVGVRGGASLRPAGGVVGGSSWGRSLLGLRGGGDAFGAVQPAPGGGGDGAAAGAAAAPPLCIGCGEGRHAYRLGTHGPLGRGSFGEVWRAARRPDNAGTFGGSSNSDSSSGGGDERGFVLKRVLGGRGAFVRLSGLREAYFGALLSARARALRASSEAAGSAVSEAAAREMEGYQHIVEYEESFEVGSDVWLVFKDAGRSLHSLLYEPLGSPGGFRDQQHHSNQQQQRHHRRQRGSQNHNQQQQHEQQQGREHGSAGGGVGGGAAGLALVGPSAWWLSARTSPRGDQMIRSVLRQLLLALSAAHAANVTHRDVKPENILVTLGGVTSDTTGDTTGDGGGGLAESLHARLIDWGSAADAYTIGHLYGPEGPGLGDLTLEYAPPEVTFAGSTAAGAAALRAGPARAAAYDIWSTGVVMLELVLGTPHVFALSPSTRAALDRRLRLRGRPAGERGQLYQLRGMMELCIYPPRAPAHHTQHQQKQPPPPGGGADGGAGALLLPWSCSDSALLRLVASRDPTGRGLGSVLALRLAQRLLAWDPGQRPTAAQALRHAYLTAAAGGGSNAAAAEAAAAARCGAVPFGEEGWC